MTTQLTVQQMEKIVDTLPITDGKTWAVRQQVTSEHSGIATTSRVGAVKIISPGEHFVGEWVAPMVYRPSGSTPYWVIQAMAAEGWSIAEPE